LGAPDSKRSQKQQDKSYLSRLNDVESVIKFDSNAFNYTPESMRKQSISKIIKKPSTPDNPFKNNQTL